MPENSDLIRLSKRMSELGLCSRRLADDWIARGWVKVDGQVVKELGSKVSLRQKITVDQKAKCFQSRQVTILLNKPLGFVSGQAEDGHEPAKVLITAENRWKMDSVHRRFDLSQLKSLVPAGRLDINSTGLLVLTQDGRIAKTLIGDKEKIEKEYLVRVRQTNGKPNTHFPKAKLALLNYGLTLDDKPLKRAKVEWINADQLRFILQEGKKRQIRRMCELVGLEVLALKRVRIGSISLGNLPLGQWRYLRDDESFNQESSIPSRREQPPRRTPRKP